MNQPVIQTELASALERFTATLDRLDAQHSDLSGRVERIVAAVESDSSIQQLYSRLAAAEEKSAQLAALNSDLRRLASDFQAQAERLAAENSQLAQQVSQLHAEAEGLKSQTSAFARTNPAIQSFSAPARCASDETVGLTAAPRSSGVRKTLSPAMSALLAKSGIADLEPGHIDAAALDKTLSSLSVEQRIAVKAEMARAGMIE